MTKENKCGCGRSPTGKCIGWHALSEEDYLKKKENFRGFKKWKHRYNNRYSRFVSKKNLF